MKMKAVTLNREVHKWLGVVLSLFLVIISLTGFFLIHKKSLKSFEEIDVPSVLIPDSYGKEMEKRGKEIKAIAVAGKPGSAPMLLTGTKGGLRDDRGGRSALTSPLTQVEVKALLLTEHRWLAGAKKGLYESLNGGRDWMRVKRAPFAARKKSLRVETLARSPENTAILWLGAKDGLFRSPDGGAVWEDMTHILPDKKKSRHVSIISFDPNHAGRTLIGTHSGLFSFDSGAKSAVSVSGLTVAATPMQATMNLHKYLDKLHTGGLFSDELWWLYDLTAIAMILFVGTGLYIWMYPTLAKRRKKRAKAALERSISDQRKSLSGPQLFQKQTEKGKP